MHFSAADFLDLGLGFGRCWTNEQLARTCEKTKRTRFKRRFGAEPESCEAIFRDLQETDIEDARVDSPKPHELLCALNYLKEYPLESNLAGNFSKSERTAMKWAHFYVKKLQGLKADKVSTINSTSDRSLPPFLNYLYASFRSNGYLTTQKDVMRFLSFRLMASTAKLWNHGSTLVRSGTRINTILLVCATKLGLQFIITRFVG
jgi:hypothetical protein